MVKKASLVSDPIEKLKIMSLNLFITINELGEQSLKQPLNPILGETYYS